MGTQASSRALLCPLCKEKEKSETLMVPVPLGPLGETYCKEHGEKIYFFCENDADFLCVLCREGPSHQAHTVGFLDEAIQPYRVRRTSAHPFGVGQCTVLEKGHGFHIRGPQGCGDTGEISD